MCWMLFFIFARERARDKMNDQEEKNRVWSESRGNWRDVLDRSYDRPSALFNGSRERKPVKTVDISDRTSNGVKSRTCAAWKRKQPDDSTRSRGSNVSHFFSSNAGLGPNSHDRVSGVSLFFTCNFFFFYRQQFEALIWRKHPGCTLFYSSQLKCFTQSSLRDKIYKDLK